MVKFEIINDFDIIYRAEPGTSLTRICFLYYGLAYNLMVRLMVSFYRRPIDICNTIGALSIDILVLLSCGKS